MARRRPGARVSSIGVERGPPLGQPVVRQQRQAGQTAGPESEDAEVILEGRFTGQHESGRSSNWAGRLVESPEIDRHRCQTLPGQPPARNPCDGKSVRTRGQRTVGNCPADRVEPGTRSGGHDPPEPCRCRRGWGMRPHGRARSRLNSRINGDKRVHSQTPTIALPIPRRTKG